MNRGIIKKMLRSRYGVTLKANEGSFAGVLLEADRDLLVFDDCRTVPTQPDQSPVPIPGRVYVDRRDIAYLQELTA